MAVSQETVMAIRSYQSQAEVLVKNILSVYPIIPYTSILIGILTCKVFYDLTELISTSYFRCWAILTKAQRVEWNERGISTIHALYITSMSLYFVFWSDLFSDQQLSGPVTFRSSQFSTSVLGMSAGYFLSDLAMIIWQYPSLGGMEYVIHHSISIIAVTYCMVMGEGQIYTYMVLISEVTTPEINMRWYLDMAGMKKSTAYIINGIMIFLAWLVARILLFVYVFYHIYMHHKQVIQMHRFSVTVAIVVPSVLAVMNMIWFWKIVKGLMKTLAKRQRDILPYVQASVNDRDK